MIISWVRMFWAIRISGFEIFGFFRILGPCGHNLEAIMLKLGVNDHLMGPGHMGHPDIRISALEIFGFFFRFYAPVVSILKLTWCV